MCKILIFYQVEMDGLEKIVHKQRKVKKSETPI